MQEIIPFQETTIVGIGASAGGVEALKQFFSCLPADSGLAYVIVVHLLPDQPSLLADLLQPLAPLPVIQVSEDVSIAADNAYVIPPGADLSIIDGHLRLSSLAMNRRERSPVDHFFTSLAQTHAERCVGVVLSGTGSDGSIGIAAIKEQGGLTIVQEPSEAAFSGMPQSAIATGQIDLVLSIDDMSRHILGYVRTRPRLDIADDSAAHADNDRQPLHHQIIAELHVRSGQDFSCYKRSTVLRRIRRRMQLHRLEQLGDYLALLRTDADEAVRLAAELLITVTRFFRDHPTFEQMEQEFIPPLFEHKTAADQLRVWSVGCATGEEAYSIAILLLERASLIDDPPRLEVFASDLHAGSLALARAGTYPDSIAARVSSTRLRRFFTKHKGGYRVDTRVREMVVFSEHDLLKDPPFSRLDLIVCRNLLIYLQRETQEKVIKLFHYALAPNGLLWLGPAETIERTALFKPKSMHCGLYQRRNAPAADIALPVFPSSERSGARAGAWPARAPMSTGSTPSYGALHQKMVERWAMPSLLLDQDFSVVHVSERAGRYLQVPGGEPSTDVFNLVRKELSLELRAALQSANERGEAVHSGAIDLMLDGSARRVVVQVRPPAYPSSHPAADASADPSVDQELVGLNLVVFDETAPGETASPSRPPSSADNAQLDRINQRLHRVIAQYDASREEMRLSNEELQSVNEELRSTMEELETGKEELQSMNEELQTVNQENRHRVEELGQLTSDLDHLMAATEIATVFLDSRLRILRFTPRAAELFCLRDSDRGRPLDELRALVPYKQLGEDVRSLLRSSVPPERELCSEHGEWFLTRVLPYRVRAAKISGVVITLVEITQLKQAQLALGDSEERFRALVTASAQIVWTTDASGRMIEDSPSWRAFTGQSQAQWSDQRWIDAIHPDDRDGLLEDWRHSLASEMPLEREFRVHHVDGDWHWTHMRAVPLNNGGGAVRGWVGMHVDITSRKRVEQQLRDDDQRKDAFLATLGHELRNPLAPLSTAISLFKRLGPTNPETDRLRAIMERQVQHLTRLVDDLLDVARIKSGHITLQQQRVDLKDVVRTSVVNLQSEIEHGTLRLTEARSPLPEPGSAPKSEPGSEPEPESEPLVVNGDEVRLVQAVTNLLHNAVKFSPDGGQLQVGTWRDQDDALISVRDQGIGLTADMQERIFDIFVQGPRNPARAPAGLGLGLTLVRQLAQLHGGSVTARSEGPGRGSEFILRLPLAAQPEGEDDHIGTDAPANTAEAGARSTAPIRVPTRILVVDDNADAAASLAMAMELDGHQVKVASTGKDAMEQAARFRPRVLVLDIGLPDMDGYSLARALRKQPESAEALLIAVTGYGQRRDRERALAAGFNLHLTKPVSLETLLSAIATKG